MPRAGFNDETYRLLKQQPGLLGDLVGRILDTHFPETMHDDIRQALGLDTLYETGAVQQRPTSACATRASASWC